ncbi:MAG: TVP38/TMEM64 family protein [Dehalococcoidia bacterium]
MTPGTKIRLVQLALVLTVAAAFGGAYLFSDGFRAEVGTAASVLGTGDVTVLREYLRSFGVWAPVVSLLLMVLQALAAPVPSFLITFANGLAFGLFWGWLLSIAGHVLAASVCFWIARGLGRGPVEALVGRLGLESADRWFAKWGMKGILLTRLVPLISFDAVSYAAGLTRIGFRRFIVATTIGTAPQALAYVYLGQKAPQYAWMLMVVAVLATVGVMGALLLQRRARGDRGPAVAAHPVPAVTRPRTRSVLRPVAVIVMAVGLVTLTASGRPAIQQPGKATAFALPAPAASPPSIGRPVPCDWVAARCEAPLDSAATPSVQRE